MTVLAMPGRPRHDASPRQVPWQRMAWVTWRQHRAALAGMVALLAALAGYLLIAGLRLHHAYAAATACRPASSATCLMAISDINGPTAELTAALLQGVPAMIGAFTGAPVLARELETGTFRYAWTQGFGRWRWALAKLVTLAVAVAAATGAFSLLFAWYYQPFLADGWQIPLGPLVFDLRGVSFAAWTLAAFAIGALAGMITRRVVPAIAVTLAACAGLVLTASLYLRQHYMTPLATSHPDVPGSAWIMGTWWTRGGTFAFGGRPSFSLVQRLCPSAQDPDQCLAGHGYTQWTSYQPGSRFWPFQWIEGGWLLALSALLIAATILLVRRRAA